MKRILFFVFACCLMGAARAQKVYFIYLQSENSSPFFVKMQDKVHSSSPAGYVILSNLKDSIYLFNIGFPGNPQEKKFGVTIDKGDRGFLLRTVDGDLGLYDLQTSVVLKPVVAEGMQINGAMQTITKTDPFTTRLSQAANDASLLTVSVPVASSQPGVASEKKEVKQETIAKQTAELGEAAEKSRTEPDSITGQPVAGAPVTQAQAESKSTQVHPTADSTMVASVPAVPDSGVKEVVAFEEEVEKVAPVPSDQKAAPSSVAPGFKRSIVQKRSESSTTEGFGLLFTDELDGAIDTIRLLIPNPKKTFVDTAEVKDAVAASGNVSVKQEPGQEESKKEEHKVEEEGKEEKVKSGKKRLPKFLDFSAPEVRPAKMKNVEEAKEGSVATCPNVANERDFIRLRKYMASETNDEAMIDEAKKYFKNTCFSTEQIKNLSTLFLTSAAKYQFFDAAYPHVLDKDQFPSLESEIKDAYYLKRFKALIGE